MTFSPRQVGPDHEVSLTGKVFPIMDRQKLDEDSTLVLPLFLFMPGSDRLYLPLEDDPREIDAIMHHVGRTQYRTMKVDDGKKFLGSLDPGITAITNVRIQPDGRVLFTEVRRP